MASSISFLGIAGAGGAIYLIAFGDSVVLFLAVVVALLGTAHLCYLAAIEQGEVYGELIAVAFDLHRHGVLEELDVEVPRIATKRSTSGTMR